MGIPIQGIPPTAQPWARGVEDRLTAQGKALDLVTQTLANPIEVDRAMFGSGTPENIPNGTVGRWTPFNPVNLRFTSTTGVFEVTVGLAGKVYDGAILGAGFDFQGPYPYAVDNDIPRKGVVGTAPPSGGLTLYTNFSYSRSTILNVRPGVQNISLYYYVVNNYTTASIAYVQDSHLSIKAV